MGSAELLHFGAGVALVLVGWLVPRHIARARFAGIARVLLDVSPFVVGAGLMNLASGRPIFAGVIALALGAGFALADYTMRLTLHEPVVFSESVELPQVFTHPHLYLPFAGPGLVIGGAVGAVLLALLLLWIEPPLWAPHLSAALFLVIAIAGLGWLAAREPLLGRLAAAMRRLGPSDDPFADAEALGPFAMLLAHTVIARAERPARRDRLTAPAIVADRTDGPDVPVIVVQCESFFDARRLSPLVPPELLAGYAECCASAAMFGRIGVPGWGANTMRAEFAVLSGVPDSELGYDRFNPYYALARQRLESQVWRLRRAGYRTICLHPFDPRFFRRDLAMPALGFERFLGRETLGGSRTPPYYTDPELAQDILRVLDEAGPHCFIFAITMGNHGPWLPSGPPLASEIAALSDLAGVPGGAELLRYLDGMQRSDRMLQILMRGIEERGSPAVLGFYGDHLPSLSKAFEHFGFADTQSDYVVWRTGATLSEENLGARRDLPAHELGRAIVDMALTDGRADADPDRSACLQAAQPASLPQ